MFMFQKKAKLEELLKRHFYKEVHVTVTYENACEKLQIEPDWAAIQDDLRYCWFKDYLGKLKYKLFDIELDEMKNLKRSINILYFVERSPSNSQSPKRRRKE